MIILRCVNICVVVVESSEHLTSHENPVFHYPVDIRNPVYISFAAPMSNIKQNC